MLYKFAFNKSDIFKFIFRMIVVTVLCCFTVFVFMSIVAIIICRVDFSYEIMPPVTAAIMALATAFNGFVISRWHKEKGMICGIVAAVVTLLMFVIIALYNNTFALSTAMLLKVAIMLISGAIGGITGVNIN